MRGVRITLGYVLVLIASSIPCQAHAQVTLWHSPLGLITADPDLTIIPVVFTQPPMRGGGPVRITSAVTGDHLWVHLGLTLPSNAYIDSVHVCYALASTANYIGRTTLSKMTTPDQNSIERQDDTPRNTSPSECYSLDVDDRPVSGTFTLSFILVFGNTTDWIEIGAIGVVVGYGPPVGVNDPSLTSEVGSSGTMRNYPNPFNPQTTIEFTTSEAAHIALNVYDAAGRLVRQLVNERREPGSYKAIWDSRNASGGRVASGTYFYVLQQGEEITTRKAVVVK